jgi:biofilm PGA synthesis protein PgaD
MLPETPIISHPEGMSLKQHITSGTIASVAWAIWLFLWLPVLTGIFWLIGLHVTYKSIILAPNKSSLLLILVLVLVCNIVVSAWSSYNYVRFFKKSRRRVANAVTHEEVGRFFGVTDAATLKLLANERRLNLYFNDAGGLVRAEALKTKKPRKPRKTEAPTKIKAPRKTKASKKTEKELEASISS